MLEGWKSCNCEKMTLAMCDMCDKLSFSAPTMSTQHLVGTFAG